MNINGTKIVGDVTSDEFWAKYWNSAQVENQLSVNQF